MKRFLLFLLILVIFSGNLLISASTEAPLPSGLQEWMVTYQQNFLYSDSTALKPIIHVSGWPVYTGGDWSYQYPPSWTVLSGDAMYFMVCDSRQLACMDYTEMQTFNQGLAHDQLGAYVLSRVAGNASFQVLGTFQKNTLPQIMVEPPANISQVWFVLWQNPQGGKMFTLLQVMVYASYSAYGVGNTSAGWLSYTAPAEEFTSMWQNAFLPMFLSSTYTIPGGSRNDRDHDGQPDETDNYPDDPTRY